MALCFEPFGQELSLVSCFDQVIFLVMVDAWENPLKTATSYVFTICLMNFASVCGTHTRLTQLALQLVAIAVALKVHASGCVDADVL